MATLETLIFLYGFFWIGWKQKRSNRWIWWMLTEETLEIWYQDDMGWPDLLSKRTVNMRAMIDNLYVADELSSLDPCFQCDNSLPFGYSQLHTLAQRSRRPRDGNLQSTNSQWNNRSHRSCSSNTSDRYELKYMIKDESLELFSRTRVYLNMI